MRKPKTLRIIAAVALVAVGVIATTASGETESAGNGSDNGSETTAPPADAPEVDDLDVEVSTETPGQANAVRAARNYLEIMPYSHSGLIEQLMFEGYSEEDATYAVNSLDVDWNEQAAKAAANYLEIMPHSRTGLIEQLEFEGYTHEQATYGVDTAGL